MDDKANFIFTSDGKLKDGHDPSKTILDAWKGSNRPLVIWFHGGLVTVDAGKATAKLVGTHLEGDGYFPLFVVWDSGIGPTLIDAVAALIRRKLGGSIIRMIQGLVEVKQAFLGHSLGVAGGQVDYDLTELDKQILGEAIDRDPGLQEEIRWFTSPNPTRLAALSEGPLTPADALVDRRIREAFGRETTGRQGVVIDVAAIFKTFIFRVAAQTLSRFKNGRQHAIKETIIEEALRVFEIGKDLWDDLKGDAAANFAGGGGVRAWIDAFAGRLGEFEDRDILLAGHSTGSIFIEHFLKHAPSRAKGYHVRFLAPASRFDSMADVLTAQKGKIATIRQFGLSEPTERTENLLQSIVGDLFIKSLYKGSLLYLVCGAVEAEPDAPIVGMQRFVSLPDFLTEGERQDIQTVVDEIGKGYVWTPTIGDIAGAMSGCTTHGGFDDSAELGPKGAITSLLVRP